MAYHVHICLICIVFRVTPLISLFDYSIPFNFRDILSDLDYLN
jgi:hypothetical protein